MDENISLFGLSDPEPIPVDLSEVVNWLQQNKMTGEGNCYDALHPV